MQHSSSRYKAFITDMQTISPEQKRANIPFLYAELGWMSVAFAMEWYYLQVFAIRLGATATHLGVLTSGRALLLVVGGSLATRWGQRFTNAVDAISGPTLAYRTLLYLAIALTPFLQAFQAEALVALVLMSAIPHGIAQGVFLGMMPGAISENDLARVVSRRSVLMNAIVLVGVLVFGQLLELIPRPQNYQIGFGIAFLAAICAWFNIRKIKVPDMVKVTKDTRKVNVWSYPPFRRFAIVIVFVNMSVFIAAPITQLYLVQGLKATDSWISLLGIFEMGAGALLTLSMDRLIKRFGTRRLIIATTFATLFQALILAVTTTLPPYIIGTILFGAGWYAVNVLLYNRLVQIVPAEDLRQYAATYSVIINAALFAGPLIGTLMIETGLTIPVTLLIIAFMRLGAGVLTWAIRTEPETRPISGSVEAVKLT
jgi:MFS family permease